MNFFKLGLWAVIFFWFLNLQIAFADTTAISIVGTKVNSQQDAAVNNNVSPASSVTLPKGVVLLGDIAYGADPQQRMDVYRQPDSVNAPVLLMVHGGGWHSGDKAQLMVVQNKVARWVPKGFIFISVNYRTLPKADPLQQAEDVARALAFAQANAVSWGGNPAKFILMGHSAGAHLVDLLAANPARALALGAHPWLGTISIDSGALNVVQTMADKHYALFDAAFGTDPGYWQTVSPYQSLSAPAGPFLLICSTIRPDKPCLQTDSFAAKANSLGIHTQVLEERLSHEQINETLGLPGAYTDAVEAYMSALDNSAMRALGPSPCE